MTEKEGEKFCPLFFDGNTPRPCIKEKCRLWVSIDKWRSTPPYQLKYEGCGLVTEKPWKELQKGTP